MLEYTINLYVYNGSLGFWNEKLIISTVFLNDYRGGRFTQTENIKREILGPNLTVFFFSTTAYFVNGNTYLMSDLTDNQFYPSAERIWLYIRFAKWACDRLTEDADFGKKNHLFR